MLRSYPNLLGEDDSEIDLEVLAHQREMAARAAIISRRAAERERLRIQNANQGKDDKASDPFTGAMGNIREVEDRIAKTGVQGPKTQSVALDLNADGKLSSKKDEAAPASQEANGQAGQTSSQDPGKASSEGSGQACGETSSKAGCQTTSEASGRRASKNPSRRRRPPSPPPEWKCHASTRSTHRACSHLTCRPMAFAEPTTC